MMSVLEYAEDVSRSVDDILNICKRLDISVGKEDDMLSDDDIILLDNELENMDDAVEEAEEIDELEEIE